MSQVTIRRPFGELDLCDQLWFKPHAVFHFFLCQRPLRPFALELRASGAVGLRWQAVFGSQIGINRLAAPGRAAGRGSAGPDE